MPLLATAKARTTISAPIPVVIPSRQSALIRRGCPSLARSRYCHGGSPEQASHADPSRMGGSQVMLLVLGEVSMPGCMTRGPSATGRRRARLLCVWVLMGIGTVWTYGAPIGLPGVPESNGPDAISCPKCSEVANRQVDDSYKCDNNHVSILCPKCGEAVSRQVDDSYKCKNNHVSRKQPDGSYKSDNDPPPDPCPSASSEQNAD